MTYIVQGGKVIGHVFRHEFNKREKLDCTACKFGVLLVSNMYDCSKSLCPRCGHTTNTYGNFVGDRLKNQRRTLGMTMRELAKRAGISPSTIKKYELYGAVSKQQTKYTKMLHRLLAKKDWQKRVNPLYATKYYYWKPQRLR